MKSKIMKVYLFVQTIVFVVLAVSSIWISIGKRYDAIKEKVDYRKLYGVIFVASVIEAVETFVVLRLFNWNRN